MLYISEVLGMKERKLWTVSPLFFIFVVAMIVMTILSYDTQHLLPFFINLVITIVTLVIIIIFLTKNSVYLKALIRGAVNRLGGNVSSVELSGVATPSVIVSKNGEIITYNELFRKIICNGRDVIGNSIYNYTNDRSLEDILKIELENAKNLERPFDKFIDEKKSVITKSDIKLGDKVFKVLMLDCDNSYVMFFIDKTAHTKLLEKYNNSRPCVMMIMFDNKDELENNAEESNASEIVSMVEKELQKWAVSNSAMYKKLYAGKYLLVVERKFVTEMIKDKFPILEEIRKIKIDERRTATLSIGVGKDGESFQECEQWAKQALDMALARGGDQVAVNSNSSYTFFGGVSKGVENLDKRRTRVISMAMSERISKSEKVFIMGHKASDLDCVGASIGMWSISTKALKKEAYIVINQDTSLSKPLISSFNRFPDYKNMFITPEKALEAFTPESLLIIVDTHSPKMVECPELLDICGKCIIIDHHRKMVNYISNTFIFMHEPFASSACEMVAELAQYIGETNLNQMEAEVVLAGIMLDTKNFVLRTGVRTFEAAAYLRKRGADTVEVKRLFSNSIDTYKVKYQLISEAEIYNFCAVAVADGTFSDIRVASAQAADELLGIGGVKASFVMFMVDDIVNISARSLGDVNVQLVMEALGGGGHQTMAGTQLKMPLPEAREKLIALISNLKM